LGNELVIEELKVQVDDKEILRGVNLRVGPGEVHALMGPNGSGKSTLSNTILGHPRYRVTGGRIRLGGEDISSWPTDLRARRGIFLAFQYPTAIQGVSVANFLRTTVNQRRQEKGLGPLGIPEFLKAMREKMALLHLPEAFGDRYLNEGFSGGEKKRVEILQMALLEPAVAILDEPDSGLDIDAVRIVAEGVNALRSGELGLLVITHYQRILNYLTPDFVHVMVDGRIVRSGGPELVGELEEKGYDWLRKEAADAKTR